MVGLKRIVFIALMVLLCIPVFAASTISYQDMIIAAADEIAFELNDSDYIVLTDFDTGFEALTERINTDLQQRLLKLGRNVLERRDIGSVVSELEFQTSGLVDDDQAVSIGHMLGATKIVTGRGRNLIDYYRIEIKMIDVETSEVVLQNSFNIRYDKQFSAIIDGNQDTVGVHGFYINALAGIGLDMSMAHEDIVGTGFTPEEKAMVGFMGGIEFGYDFTNLLGLAAGIEIENNGASYKGSMISHGSVINYEAVIKYTTMDIPLMFSITVMERPVKLRIEMGGFISIPVNKAKLSYPGLVENATSLDIEGINYGIVGGPVLSIPAGFGDIVVNLKYKHELDSLVLKFDADLDGVSESYKFCSKRVIGLTFGYSISI